MPEPNEPNKTNIRLWVDALRSGEFQQDANLGDLLSPEDELRAFLESDTGKAALAMGVA